MFGSNPFGQSSSSPFGSSVFGSTSSVSTNPFAPKPFGSQNPFGAQTGSSLFGSTSTGVFGQPSTPAFGASPTPAFGSSTPAFGVSSTPAFGSSSTPAFGTSTTSSFGSSLFGQKPTFGGFGSTPTQSSPFGSNFQQTQPAFGSSPFGSTSPFGASNQPAFGSSSPAFGASSTPAFGVTSVPSFGSASTPVFGVASSPTFGAASMPAFGAASTPAFGAGSTPAFGSPTTSLFGGTGSTFGLSNASPFGGSSNVPAFGAQSTSIFGSSSTPAFGSSTGSAFGASSTPAFSFGSAPSFGQTASTFGSTPFGTTQSPFGAQSSLFGAQPSTSLFGSPSFGQSTLGGQQSGSRVASYAPTPEVDGGTGTQPAGKLESISAMPVFKEKSHEELRWDDYQRGDKGGPSSAGQSGSGIGFGSGSFGQTASNPFAPTTSSNPFAPKPSPFGSSGFGSSSGSIFTSAFGTASSSAFGSTTSTPSLFGSTSGSGFGSTTSPSLFGSATTSAFSSSPSLFGTSAMGSSSFGSSLPFGSTQSSGLFQSSNTLGQTPSPFGQPASGFQQSAPAFGSSLFSTPSTGFGSSWFSSSTPSLLPSSSPMGFGQTTPSLSSPFQPVAPPQTTSAFSFSNFGQQQASSTGFGGASSIFQGPFGQQNFGVQNSIAPQPSIPYSPFGTLPALPQVSIGLSGSSSSVQYGISNIPVSEKPIPARVSSLVVPRHLTQRRIRIPARKYHPKSSDLMVPFFAENEESESTPKADAFFIPRENPRTLIVRPIEQWPKRINGERVKGNSAPTNENGLIEDLSGTQLNRIYDKGYIERGNENGHFKDKDNASSPPLRSSLERPNGVQDVHSPKGSDPSPIKLSGHRAGEAAIVFEHGADIEALIPKLRNSDYYTEPRIQELAAKERAEPGFCRYVKDFVVGRHGYGSIKFDGETDVRRLDLELIVQFNNKEVIVYKDESKKPPVGQGLNKAAEVTLLNIKCMNKKTAQQYTEGSKVEKYVEMLKKKAEEQGAEFVSFDAAKGEWKFRVKHFSRYGFGEWPEL